MALPLFGQVESIGLGSTNSVGPLNGTDGTRFVRAFELDRGDNPVGTLSVEISISLRSQYPNISVDMFDTAPSGNKVRSNRSTASFNGGDGGCEFWDAVCPTGTVCDATSFDNIALGNNLPWSSGTVVPVELQGFPVE